MAAETPNSFITALLPFVRNRPIADADRAFLLNLANDHFCSLALWRWLMHSATTLTVGDQDQDYPVTPPGGVSILRVPMVYMFTPKGRFSVLYPTSAGALTNEGESLPALFNFYQDGAGDSFIRLWPSANALATWKLTPIIKAAHTRVTTGNLDTVSILPHPSSLNHIFSLFLLHYLYLWAQVGPQGEVVHASGPPTTRGILAQALAACDAVRSQEAIVYDIMGNPLPF